MEGRAIMVRQSDKITNTSQFTEAFDQLTASRHLLVGASIIADSLMNDPTADATSAVLTEGLTKMEEAIRKFDAILKGMAERANH